MLIFSQTKRGSTPPLIPPSTLTSNPGTPFSVTDILHPLDVDVSTSYKRSIEMAQALAATSTSSSSAYSIQRPFNNRPSTSLCNPTFGSSSTHSSYYGPSSTPAFPSNNQYYDYNTALQTSGNSTGQYSPSSCWYGSAASMLNFELIKINYLF